jgi:hypothetical protein
MVITLQQSVQVPQRLPSMMAGVIIHPLSAGKAAPVSVLGAIKPSESASPGCAAHAANLSVLQPA